MVAPPELSRCIGRGHDLRRNLDRRSTRGMKLAWVAGAFRPLGRSRIPSTTALEGLGISRSAPWLEPNHHRASDKVEERLGRPSLEGKLLDDRGDAIQAALGGGALLVVAVERVDPGLPFKVERVIGRAGDFPVADHPV